jgi:aerobic-type carbon monoxide dehydrogenase small subunit (CoxS/CutS family)
VSDREDASVRLTVNGRAVVADPARFETLISFLHAGLGLTGTQLGCGGFGVCGACVVRLNDRVIQACCVATRDLDGKEVVTVEATGRDLMRLYRGEIDG